jgi:hypothetical protein
MAIPDIWVESPPTDMLLSFTSLILLLVDDYRILSGGLPPDGKGPEQEALLRPLGKLVEYRRPLRPGCHAMKRSWSAESEHIPPWRRCVRYAKSITTLDPRCRCKLVDLREQGGCTAKVARTLGRTEEAIGSCLCWLRRVRTGRSSRSGHARSPAAKAMIIFAADRAVLFLRAGPLPIVNYEILVMSGRC